MRSDFVAFILSHGRANNIKTYNLLRKCGYTGDIRIVIDNEDPTAHEYIDAFGDEVVMFNKPYIANTFDTCDNQDNRKTIVYARNACFDLAKELGYTYFIELDDDYYYFGMRKPNDSACYIYDLDRVFSLLVDYLENSPITSIAFSQGGDHIGGFDGSVMVKRKAMNSFICSTKKPFSFIGRINEDVNTYVRLGGIGHIFLTIMSLQLDQKDTQSNKGGMTDVYIDGGTYVKSFYSVVTNPSCVKVKPMGVSSKRLHHSISWDNAVPCILQEKYKKKITLTPFNMKKMETQRQAVKEWLKSGKSITAHEAYMLCGTMRLSAIIFHLKNEKGMRIASERIYTEQTNFSKYWLEADPHKKEAIKDFLNRGNHITEEVAYQMFDCDELHIVISELRKEGMNIVSKHVKPLCGKPFEKWFVK